MDSTRELNEVDFHYDIVSNNYAILEEYVKHTRKIMMDIGGLKMLLMSFKTIHSSDMSTYKNENKRQEEHARRYEEIDHIRKKLNVANGHLNAAIQDISYATGNLNHSTKESIYRYI